MARILIVENEFLQQAFLTNVLGAQGHSLCTAGTPEQATAVATSQRPDVVILDFRLANGGDGIVVAQHILAVHACALIFLTGYSSDETTARMKALSPVAIIEKPCHPDLIVEAVVLAVKRISAGQIKEGPPATEAAL